MIVTQNTKQTKNDGNLIILYRKENMNVHGSVAKKIHI